jgi:hypothetical protein
MAPRVGEDLEDAMQPSARHVVYGFAGLALICVATIAAFAVIELGYRIHTHRPALVLDNWRAGRIEYRTFGDRVAFDPVLGWAPQENYASDRYNTLAFGIRRNFCEKEIRRGGVLAVGDVFADGGTAVADVDTWPAYLERITGVPVLNAGVAGYATDQSVLRAEKLLPEAQPKTLVLGLLDEAIGRTSLSSYGVSKPYFTLDGGRLIYHPPRRLTADEPPTPGWPGRVRGVLGYSAVLDVVLSHLAPEYWHGQAGAGVVRAIENDPVGVTCALVERLKTRADAGGVRMLVLLQYARASVAEKAEPDAGFKRIAACTTSLGIDVVDQFEGLRSLAAADPGGLGDLYLEASDFGQMSPSGNRHTAEQLARALAK